MSSPPDPEPEPTQNPQSPAWPAHGPVHGYRPPPQHPNAGMALGLGLFALVGGITCYLPILAAPFAWAVGRSTLREIDANPGQWTGRDLASLGHITGIVATVLLCLVLVALVVAGGIALYVG